jgi:hypothetical protein
MMEAVFRLSMGLRQCDTAQADVSALLPMLESLREKCQR